MAGTKLRRAALHESLSLFRTDWTRDHLLGVAPTSDAAILSSPLQQLHSLAFESDLRFDTINPGRMDFGVLSGESVVVPAYSKDNMSAGYMVEETYGFYPKDIACVCHNGVATMRFIARQDDNSVVCFTQLPHVETIIYMTKKNRNCAFHVFAFEPGTVSMLVTAGADFDAFESSMKAAIFVESAQECTNCGVSGSTPCACRQSIVRPKSPLDLGPISFNMRQVIVGQEMGPGRCEIFENGVLKDTYDMSAHHRKVNVPRLGSAKKLVNWAIRDALKTVPIAISRVIKSPFTSPHQMLNTESEYNPTFDNFSDSYPAAAAPLLLENFNTLPIISDVSPELVTTENVLNPAIVPTSEPVTCSIDASTAESFWQPSASPLIDSSIVDMPQPSETSTSLFMSQPYHSYPQHNAPNATVPQPPTPSTPNQRTTFGHIPIAPHSINNPAPKQTESIATEAMEEKMKKTAKELRAWKAYQRKLRNRESASRSNEARKQRRLEKARQKKMKATTTEVKS